MCYLNKLQNARWNDKESEVLFVFNLYNKHIKYRCVKTVHKMNYSIAGVPFLGTHAQIVYKFQKLSSHAHGNFEQ